MSQDLKIAVYAGVLFSAISALVFQASAVTCFIVFMLFFLSVPQFLWWWIEIKYLTKQPHPYARDPAGQMCETDKRRVALLGNGLAAGHGVDCPKQTLAGYLSAAHFAVYGNDCRPFSGMVQIPRLADDLFDDYTAIVLCVSTEEAFPWGDPLATLGSAFYTALLMCKEHTSRIIVLDCSSLPRRIPIWWLDNYMLRRGQKLRLKMKVLADDFTQQHPLVSIEYRSFVEYLYGPIGESGYRQIADRLIPLLDPVQ